MSYDTQNFINQVIEEIHLSRNDIVKLTRMKSVYNKYYKQIVYDTNKEQLNYVKLAVSFPNHVKNEKQMQKLLINFLNHNTYYQDKNFFYIWCKYAHIAYLTKQKVTINEIEENEGLSIEKIFINNNEDIEEQEQDFIFMFPDTRFTQATIIFKFTQATHYPLTPDFKQFHFFVFDTSISHI